MQYGVYKNVRNASWQCLIDCNITELPTSLSDICEKYKITIVENKELKQNSLTENQRGKRLIIDNKYYIVVRDTDSIQIQRYTIAHEIGHILQGADSTEYQAERFAIGILAPACVLWALNIKDKERIAEICNISITSAEIRAERMKVLYERNKFLSHPLERKVLEQFSDFIQKNKPNTFGT